LREVSNRLSLHSPAPLQGRRVWSRASISAVEVCPKQSSLRVSRARARARNSCSSPWPASIHRDSPSDPRTITSTSTASLSTRTTEFHKSRLPAPRAS
jgi:hypothetical protein